MAAGKLSEVRGLPVRRGFFDNGLRRLCFSLQITIFTIQIKKKITISKLRVPGPDDNGQ